MIADLFKVIFGTICVLTFPVIAVVFVLACRALLRKFRWFSCRHYLPQKVNDISGRLAVRLSAREVIIGEFALAASCMWLFVCYLKVSDPVAAAVILVTLSAMPLATLAILFCRSKALDGILGCPFCVWLRWTSMLILIWVGHTRAASQISEIFLGASVHLPLATSAAAFLSAIGVLSIPTALMFDVLVVLLFLVIGAFDTRKSFVPWKTRLTGVASVTAIFLQLGVYQAAQGAVGLSGTGKIIVADFAWEFDMLDESVCTGIKSKRKIVFVGEDQSRAFVFANPVLSLSESERSKPIRLMKAAEIDAKLPEYKGVEECKYSSPM